MITQLFISKSLVDVEIYFKICSRHDISSILLKLALNTDRWINQNLTEKSQKDQIDTPNTQYACFQYHHKLHW